jgi:hypothetical protein
VTAAVPTRVVSPTISAAWYMAPLCRPAMFMVGST